MQSILVPMRLPVDGCIIFYFAFQTNILLLNQKRQEFDSSLPLEATCIDKCHKNITF